MTVTVERLQNKSNATLVPPALGVIAINNHQLASSSQAQ